VESGEFVGWVFGFIEPSKGIEKSKRSSNSDLRVKGAYSKGRVL